jgi:hypothetical protein
LYDLQQTAEYNKQTEEYNKTLKMSVWVRSRELYDLGINNPEQTNIPLQVSNNSSGWTGDPFSLKVTVLRNDEGQVELKVWAESKRRFGLKIAGLERLNIDLNGASESAQRIYVPGSYTFMVKGFRMADAYNTKADIIGTWVRFNEGKQVQMVRFGADGRFDMDYPAAADKSDTKESGSYFVQIGGKSITFDSNGVSYFWQIDFKGKDEFAFSMQIGDRRLESTFVRRK